MPETTMVFLTGLIGTVLVTALFGAALGGAWLLGRDRGRRRAIEELRATPAGDVEQHLARIDRTLDALAIDVERIAEVQRYTAGILADRAPASLPIRPRSPERLDTPH